MERLVVLACLVVLCAAQTPFTPRGARPVEHGTRSEKCDTQSEWPFCTSDDWGPKCPSGCRVQGLMDKQDHTLLKKIEKIRNFLDQNTAKQRRADETSKRTYNVLRDKLILNAKSDDDYYDLAQNLRQRIMDLKIKIDRQVKILAALKDRVRDQVGEMQKLEVDIDIKLRSCKGSCSSYAEYQVEAESYVALEKQVDQLDSQQPQSVESAGTLYVMKSRRLKEDNVDTIYKSGTVGTEAAAQQTEDMFPEANNYELILEFEGSSSSPATVSKEPGTSYSASVSPGGSSSSSSSSSSSTSSSTASKSITQLGGHGVGGDDLFGGDFSSTHMTSQTISCTKTRKKTIVHTKDGPVEKIEEVVEGGPECQAMTDLGGGGLNPFTTTHTSSSTKTHHYLSDTKGSITGDIKLGTSDPFVLDMGHFATDNADADVPDFQARSLKPQHVKREANYVGKACARLKQLSQDGRRPPGRGRPTRQCRAKPHAALCSDDDWVSRCPSGCRLQGLISQTEGDVARKLRKLCEAAKAREDAAEESMAAVTHVYGLNRRAVVSRHVSELKFVERAEELARKLASIRRRSSRLLRRQEELRRKARDQLEDLYRAEVDIDVKLRACRGSCRSAPPFAVSHPDYHALQTDLDRVDRTLDQRSEAAALPQDVSRLRLQPVDVGPVPSAGYKSIPAVQRELLTQFEDIGQNRLVLEELSDSAGAGDLQ